MKPLPIKIEEMNAKLTAAVAHPVAKDQVLVKPAVGSAELVPLLGKDRDAAFFSLLAAVSTRSDGGRQCAIVVIRKYGRQSSPSFRHSGDAA